MSKNTDALKFDQLAYEWTVAQCKQFAITVRCWKFSPESDTWNWNVYANIYEAHPMFGNVEWATGLPLHWGATFDKFITFEKADQKYGEEKPTKTLKVGCDYMHCDDHRFEHADPKDGIYWEIKSDIGELFDALNCAIVAAAEEAERAK